MIKWIIYITIAIIALSLFIVAERLKASSKDVEDDLINETLSSEAGVFKISGERRHFWIEKDERYSFEVTDGEIVSVKDRQNSNAVHRYKG